MTSYKEGFLMSTVGYQLHYPQISHNKCNQSYFYDTQVRSSFMTFCKADCYGSAEVKMLITKYILVKASDVELHKFCPDSLDADPSHRYNIHIRLILPCRETMPEN
jgi:hypothetical protein